MTHEQELYETITDITKAWADADLAGMNPEESDSFFTKQIESVSNMSYDEAMKFWEENHEPVEDLQNHYVSGGAY